MKKIIYKSIASVLIFSHIFTICLHDMAFAQTSKSPVKSISLNNQKVTAVTKEELIGSSENDKSGSSVVQRYRLSSDSSSNPTPVPEKIIKSFHLDPYSGSAVINLPFVVPSGINGMQPNIVLTYSPHNGNGIFGFGWNINLNAIERSTKNGVPKYDSTDTFICSLNGTNSELIPVGQDAYRAKIEGAFLKLKFKGSFWEVKDKQGNAYIFGQDNTNRITNPQGVFRWYLERVTDINGNYMVVSYFKEGNQIYPKQIQWTSNDMTQELSKFTVDFVLEDREDFSSNYRSGNDISVTKRIKEIIAKVKDNVFKRYVLEYKYSFKTKRSLLYKITEYGYDGTAAPPINLDYQDITDPAYNIFAITGDPTQGDNLWNLQHFIFTGNGLLYDSSILTQASGDYVCCLDNIRLESHWQTEPNGDIKFSSTDPLVKMWTYVYVKEKKTISLSLDARDIVFMVNGDSYHWDKHLSVPCNLNAGYNLIEFGFRLWPNGTVTTSNLLNNVDLMNSSQVVLPQLSGDFNGDGKTDVGTFFSSTGNVKVALSNGECFLPKQSWIENFAVNQKLLLGDFNADGKTDICGFDSATGNWQVALSDGSKFVDNGIWLANFGNGQDGNQVQAGDFNGDGKTDICVFYKESGSLRCYIALNNGAGFEVPLAYKPYIGSDKDSAFLGDFNGDGLIDIACFNYDTGDWKFKINDGAFKDFKELETVNGFGAKKNIVVSDFNSDGLTDIGYYNYDTGKIMMRLSNGNSFSTSKELPLQFKLADSSIQIQSADYNGDGLVDFCAYNAIGNLELALSQGEFIDMLSKVDNGLGGTLELKYAPSSKYDNTGEDEITDLPFVIPVLSESVILDGQGSFYNTTYNYSGGLYSISDREFRGFACTSIIDSEGTYSQAWYKQDAVFKGRLYRQEIKDKDGKLYSRSENIWESKELYPGVKFPYISQTDNYTFDETNSNTHTRIKFEYNDDGNPTKIFFEGDTQSTGDEKIQVTEYARNASQEVISLPKYTYLENSQGNKVSQKWFYYDNHNSIDDIPGNGRLTKEEIWLYNPITGTEQRVNNQYAYDKYGNLISIVDALGRVTTTVYDKDYHIYPVQITNPLGQITEVIYYGVNEPTNDKITGCGVFGQEKYTLDTNNQKIYKIYDNLGRIIKVVGPYDTEEYATVRYVYDLDSRPIKISSSKKINENNYITIHQFYDGLGRLIQTKLPAENDPQTGQKRQIIEDTVRFDSRGQIREKYFPYYVNESPDYIPAAYQTKHIIFNYDALGRTVELTNPDTTSYKTKYYCDKTMSIDENGHSKIIYTDVYSQIVKVEEYNQGEIYTTTYEYDVLGNLIKITDNQQNITQIWYDSLGRKIKMDDADMGIWTYEYDVLGNLSKQSDAKGHVLTFEYDALNRLTKKSSIINLKTSILTAYIYDDIAKDNCVGRLSKVTDQSGSTEFFYDKLGREIKSIKTVNSKQFTVNRDYDSLDRITKLTYPDGEIVMYEYNPQGIQKVYSGNKPLNYVTSIEYTPTSQIKKINYGNGTSTEYNYDQNTLRLEHLTTQSPKGKIQDLNYQFDKTGNVKEISDHCNTATQSFIYDDLNRLTQASGSYGIYNYVYDSIGNMLNKEGNVLSYGKAGRLPHAVTQYGDTKIDYDANGNMVSKSKVSQSAPYETMSYDAENRLIKVDNKTNASSSTVSLTLNPGWNFISFPFILQDSKIEKTLEPIKGKYGQVSRYNSAVDKYEHYIGNSKYSQFDTFEYGRGYQIYITAKENVVLAVTGKTPDTEQSILIRANSQNLIFCPAVNEINIEEGLKPLKINLDYSKVSHYDKAKKRYEEYSSVKKEFTTLQPGEAYFIYGLKANTWKITYTPVSNTTTFVYDGDGGRVQKTINNGQLTINSTTYIGSLYESESDGTTRKHIFAGANRICTVNCKQSTASYAFYHTDHIGSSNVITDADGNQTGFTEFTPYGTIFRQTGTVDPKYKFTGKELDGSTGLYYYGARYYDPQLGRFITADSTVHYPYDPQDLNRYTYCRNNPINYVDPTGEFWFIPVLIAIAQVAAVVSAVATVGGIISAVTGNEQLANTFFKVGMIAGGVSLVAGIGAYAFSTIAASNVANQVGANLVNSVAEEGSIELERIVVKQSVKIVAQETAWQVSKGAVTAGIAGSISTAVSAASSALTTALSTVITPIYTTISNPGYNYGTWIWGEKNLGSFYGACLDSAYLISQAAMPLAHNPPFYQYYGSESNPASTWVTRTLYDPKTAMQKLSAPKQWDSVRQIKVPWYRYVDGPRLAASKFGQSGRGWEYNLEGLRNWGEYLSDWGKYALEKVTKIFGK